MIFSSLEIPFGSFHSFSFSLVYIHIFLCVFEREHVRILSSTIFVTSVFCLYWLSVSLLLPITSNFFWMLNIIIVNTTILKSPDFAMFYGYRVEC